MVGYAFYMGNFMEILSVGDTEEEMYDEDEEVEEEDY